jgi:hypothetical protein
MSNLLLRARTGAAAGVLAAVAAIVTMAAFASSALADQVPASAGLQGTPVTSSSSVAASAAPKAYPLRVRDPQQYAAQKAAADARYQQWQGTQPSSADAGLGSPSSVFSVPLNKPGLDYTVDTCTISGVVQPGCNTPPDTTGAAGPAHYVEFVNSEIAVYNKSTLALVSKATEDAFTLSSSTCDGQIKWDQASNRWVYYSLDCGAAAGSNGFSFGFSKSNNPSNLTTAGWCKYHFSTGSNLEDYGKLGNYNTGWIVGANEFPDAGGFNITVIGLRKPAGTATITTCPSEGGTIFHPSSATNSTPEPANLFGSSANGYIPATDGGTPSTHLRMLRMTGAGSAASPFHLFQDASITVPSYSVPPNVTQPGGGVNKVDSSDTRLTQSATTVDPKIKTFGIWTQHTVAGPGGKGSVVRWYELRDGATTPVQAGTIAAPGTGNFAFNAAISPNIVGSSAGINYNTGGPTTLISLRSRIHLGTAANGVTTNETVLGTSTGIVNDFSCPSHSGSSRPCRWGDYAGASFDPVAANHFAVWGTGELTSKPDTTTGIFLARWLTRNFEEIVN